ncbi:potassium transporter [Lacihabitans sp. LS3-19]|uniref:ion channel n=1 Tax=Lacihabitans sp. LS3-19 TaxID=2487335 RepID=UPI0020CB6DAE|nr:ion channel [Lacihabitans sp. LS3-19]MCP9768088.1 potassium transporter [Lacihabitans sp. LS3-19]
MAKRINLVEREKQREDTGFGTNAISTNARLVNQEGNFNVKKIGQSFEAKMNIFHRLITMPWAKFYLYILFFYMCVNLIFGIIYYSVGVEYLQGVDAAHGLSEFWEAFYFSSQTLTTVGYGRVSPVGQLVNFIAAIEALIGLMTFAIMTGLLYGRFSRPVPRILYSDKALISPYLDINALMVRIANEKSNQIINAEANLIFSRNETINGEIKRKYYNLPLERSKVKFFATSWTIVHPITEDSVLVGETLASLRASDAEILLTFEGTNDTFADPIHSRKSYMYDEVEIGRKFLPILDSQENYYILDLNKLSETEAVLLN